MTHFSTVKRVIALAGAGAMLFSVAACGGGTASGGGKTTLKFAAFEGGYGADMYKEVVAAYEKLNPDVKIELTTSKKIEDEITPTGLDRRTDRDAAQGQGHRGRDRCA